MQLNIYFKNNFTETAFFFNLLSASWIGLLSLPLVSSKLVLSVCWDKSFKCAFFDILIKIVYMLFYKVKIFTFSSSAKPIGSSLSLVLIGDEFKKWVSFSFVKDKSKALIKSKLVKKNYLMKY